MFLSFASTSNLSLISIRLAILMIFTRRAYLFKYSAILVIPIGYISKTGDEGTTSLMGLACRQCFLKSYTLGACKSTKSYFIYSTSSRLVG
jgi:hypothetical protein